MGSLELNERDMLDGGGVGRVMQGDPKQTYRSNYGTGR